MREGLIIVHDRTDPNVFWVKFVRVWAKVYRTELEELLSGKRTTIKCRRIGY